MKKKTLTAIVIVAALGIVAFILYRTKYAREGMATGDGVAPVLPDGCYPMEEVHEVTSSSYPDQMWVSIIPKYADGEYTVRPGSDAAQVGDQFTISNTTSALDGTYPILGIYYDDRGEIGSFRTNIPAGYNFNYNAWQGDYDPRDMTYFGKGNICLI